MPNSTPLIAIPLSGNVETPGSIIKELPIFKKLIYVILVSVLSIGVIIYFSIKKTKWVLSLIVLATIGLAFSVYQFFKKTQ